MPRSIHAVIFVLPLLLTPLAEMNAQQSAPLLQRVYKDGERHRYKMNTMYYQNGSRKSETIAVCEITVSKDSAGLPAETLRWISQKVFNGTDTLDETAMAQRVGPYSYSLHAEGSLRLPEITEPGMTGAITDFHTFCVAISSRAGLGSLREKGDHWQSSSPVKGNFANGKTILKGEDCITISNDLIAIDDKKAVIATKFLPPSNPCLQYYLPDMAASVAGDTLNNIQMIMYAGKDKVNLQFGKELFEITSHLARSSGLLEQAVMKNELRLKLRVNCNEKLDGCQAELPWTIYREVTLSRIPD